jgi:transposase InsO family protein
VYRRIARALTRAGETAGRDRVARLMRQEGVRGAKRRGKRRQNSAVIPRVLRVRAERVEALPSGQRFTGIGREPDHYP